MRDKLEKIIKAYEELEKKLSDPCLLYTSDAADEL